MVLIEDDADLIMGDNHYLLFDAARDGDVTEFMKYAHSCNTHDLEAAFEVASKLEIVKYIVEEKMIVEPVFSCYFNSIKHKLNDITTYLETMFKFHLIEILKEEISETVQCLEGRKMKKPKETWTLFENDINNEQHANLILCTTALARLEKN